MLSNMTKEERVLRTINRQEIDYLPSNIVFADRAREIEIAHAFGLSSVDELNDYLDNHMHLTLMLQDKPMFFRDVKDEINKLHDMRFCNPDWENNIVYDNWGIGIRTGMGSFFADFHPLQQKSTKRNAEFMPDDSFENVLFENDFEKAVKKYKIPNIYKPGNFSEWEEDLKKYSGKYLVWPSGYAGIYERSYLLTGWEEFMTNISLKPNSVEELLDKVTDYKIEAAKNIVKLGFKIAHAGDDMGTQTGGFFSEKMFKKFLLPRLKRQWEIFNKANIPIMLHSCGNIIQYIPDLIVIGLKILEPVQPVMDLKYLKREFGKDLIFFGGIDTQKLPQIGPEEVKNLVRDTIRTLGRKGGLIISTSQEIMNDVPIENIKSLIKTIKEEREAVLY